MPNPQHVVKIFFIATLCFSGAFFRASIDWGPKNPLFKHNDVEIKLPLKSKLIFVCPNPTSAFKEQGLNLRKDQLYENMWIVEKHEYDTCKVNISSSSLTENRKRIMRCDTPLNLKYYEMVFTEFSVGGLEFQPGKKYYFIATSNGTSHSLSNYEGGHCVSSNMKLTIYVCNGSSDPKCTDAQTVSPSPSISCRTHTETVNYCVTPSISSSILLPQSSPQTLRSASSSISPTSSAFAQLSPTAAQCQTESIPEELYTLFINQTYLWKEIYNYTSMIPNLQLLIQGMNASRSLYQTEEQQDTNTTQNCTDAQVPQANLPLVAPVCTGIQAPVRRNCKEILDDGYTLSGIYRIDPLDGEGGIGVYCDQETAGGGWTISLRRYDGSINFDRAWIEYLDGLGDVTGELWMGLNNLRRLTGDNQFTIRFDLEAPDGQKKYAEYSGSRLGDKGSKFQITVGNYSGDAGDAFTSQTGMKFTTKNKDNDDLTSDNCADISQGGWWFNDCGDVCLTGKYMNGSHSSLGIVGIQWFQWKGADYSLSRVEMKMRLD